MDSTIQSKHFPEILAPAGGKPSFLAALAAEADAIYCGLTAFSARMAAKNFGIQELASLTRLANDRGTRVYVAFNTLVKPDEIGSVATLVDQLRRHVRPDALIIQDLGLITIARQAGFEGEFHLSTLSNVTFQKALESISDGLDVRRVVLPRELSVDEIKAMDAACPPGLKLESFVHGALCYAVSGRCYWSSYLGGKSGLRGRCVQPCRRRYSQGGGKQRYFSCQDLSVDVLAKVLRTIPSISAWKIEGRKKGPHYVYYTTRAYKLLRDHHEDPKSKKEALEMLAYALGRQGTHYRFLPQRIQSAVPKGGQTASGLFVGKVQGGTHPFLVPRERLLSGDVLRVGYEDEPWHGILNVGRSIPKKGKFILKSPGSIRSPKGIPVFLTDRREPELNSMLKVLEKEIPAPHEFKDASTRKQLKMPGRNRKRLNPVELQISRKFLKSRGREIIGTWLSSNSTAPTSKQQVLKAWWCLPPVIWPDDEDAYKGIVSRLLRNGGRNFLLNAPWQIAFFPNPSKLNLWAGPFCNIANPFAIEMLYKIGFSGAVVSPELGRQDYVELVNKSPLPLGIVMSGFWPLCIARTISEDIQLGQPFKSPKGESAWVAKYGTNYWTFPNWQIDLKAKKTELQKSGYSLFLHLSEPVPKSVQLRKRPGLWNWDVGLK